MNSGYKKKVKFKKIWLLIPAIMAVVIKVLFFVPIKYSGGFAGIDGVSRVSIIKFIINNYFTDKCVDCYIYHILWGKYLLGIILVFIITLICSFIISFGYYILKGEKKNV